MQETTRLVALMRRYVATFAMAACLLLPSAGFAQASQDTPVDSSDDSWGEKGQPKNFVRSKEPAKDGHAYNWLQLAYAGVVMVGMVGFMVWLVRRTPSKKPPAPETSAPKTSDDE